MEYNKLENYVVVKNDEDEATFKQLKKFGDMSKMNSLLLTDHASLSLRIEGKVVKKEKRY